MVFGSIWVPDPENIAITFGSLGVLFHLSVIPLELDEWSPQIFRGFILSWGALCILFSQVFEMTASIALQRATLAGTSFLAAAGTSMITYRLFFHRLNNFPGPFAAKVTRFSAMYDAHTSGLRYHQQLDRLHQKYGDFVRVGTTTYDQHLPIAQKTDYIYQVLVQSQ